MEIVLERKIRTEKSTIGEMFVDDVKECYSIEDKDRGLTSTMTLAKIASLKKHSVTAIPTGRYRVVVSFSNRFKKYLPEILDVPGYAGIRIHPGNKSEDTEGCILPGQTKTTDFVGNSKVAFNALFKKIQAAEKKEKIYITIK